MSTTLTNTNVGASLSGGEAVTQGAVTANFNVTHVTASSIAANALTAGSGNGQAQHVVSFTANVNTTGTTYDLTALVGGLDGSTRNFTSIKGIIIENTDATNSIIIGNAASNAWTGISSGATSTTPPIEPGGFWAEYSPNTGFVTSATNKAILIKAAANTANIKVTVVGVGS